MKTLLMAAACAALAGCCACGAGDKTAEPGPTTLISHRGESVDAPENTLPAYQTAVARGFGFECDVYLSADKRVYTFHDSNLKRTSGGACDKKCADANWETEISKLDVGGWGKWKGSKFVGTRPALLEEVLALARDGRYIYVEVKPGPEIVPYIKDIFAKQTKATPRNTLFITFNKETCKALKAQMPAYKTYWLSSSRHGWKKTDTPVTADELLAGLKETGADGLDVQFNPSIITEEVVRAVKAAGYEFHVWTIDNLDTALLAFARGAQTVTTNRAQGLVDEYRARAAQQAK